MARQCENERCKYAVVVVNLSYVVERIYGDRLDISWHIISKMGRTQTWSSSLDNQVNIMTVPDGAEVIGESEIDKKFRETVKFGKEVTILGTAGVGVVISFDKVAR